MKIAQLHPYPPEIGNQIPILPGGIAQGGSETSSFRYASTLAKLGHEVTYYAAKYPGITVDSIKISDRFQVIYRKTIFKNIGPALSFRLFIDLLTNDYDVIQSHQIPTMFSLIGAIAAALRRKPFIITFHGRLPFNFIDSFVGTLASMLSTKVTVQNQYAYDLVKGFVPKKKLGIIPHGIDTELFHRKVPSQDTFQKFNPNHEKVILFVGRLIPAKGVDVLIDAFALLSKELKGIRLVIAGDGPQRKDYQLRAKTSGSGEHIAFVGLVSQRELPELYSLASVFVLPSTYHYPNGVPIPKVSENFGLVIGEAMSCEVPVVASRVGGIPLWIDDGKTARLVAERDIIGLKNAMHMSLTDSKEERQIVQNAKAMIAERYSWEAVIKQFEVLFTA